MSVATWSGFFLAHGLFSVLAASFGASVASTNIQACQSLILPLFLGSIGIIYALAFSRSTADNALWRSSLLLLFGFFQGIMISPLMAQVAQVDPAIPLKAFLLTCVVFGCFSLAALLTTDRRFLYLYGVLSTCLLGLCVLTILNVFVQSPFVQNLWLYGGLVLFSLFVAVDTQVIIERALRGDSDSVHSALDLFLDALNIFIRIMLILARNKKSSNGNSIV